MDITSTAALKARRIFFIIAIFVVTIYSIMRLCLWADLTFGFNRATFEAKLMIAGPALGIFLLVSYPALRLYYALRDY